MAMGDQGKKSLTEKLTAIRNAIDDTIIVRVGLTKRGDIDIIDVKNVLQNKNSDEGRSEEINQSSTEESTGMDDITYIG